MALSHQATTVAILRRVLGPIHGQEKRFANTVGKSVSWVKKVSAGLMPLNEDSARVLAAATGVDLAWLMDGDIQKPPVNAEGQPYTTHDFQSHRAALSAGDIKKLHVIAINSLLPKIAAIGSAAGMKGKASLFHWRLKNFLKECRDEFGFDEAAQDQVMAEFQNAKFPYMAFHDASRNPLTDVITTFGMSTMEDMIVEPKPHRKSLHPKKRGVTDKRSN